MIKCGHRTKEFLAQLRGTGQDFELRATSASKQVKWDGQDYLFAKKHFRLRDLNYFQKFKKHVREQIDKKGLEVPSRGDFLYHKFKKFADNIGEGEYLEFDNIIELDINKAYYTAANNHGYLSDSLYYELIGLDKPIRLSLVGSLATQKDCFVYEKGKLEHHYTKVDKELRRVFFHLVDETDQALYDFTELAGDKFLFYWVDAIFLTPYDGLEAHITFLERKYGFTFSWREIEKVRVYNKGGRFNVVEVEDEKEIRPFTTENLFLKENQVQTTGWK